MSFFLIPILTVSMQGGEIALAKGMVISKSVKIKRDIYNISSIDEDDNSKGAIVINGDNITVDFNGAERRGNPTTTPPDERKGTGIEVRGKNVTIRNATVRGYKNGLIAWETPGLKIFDSDFSYNWKQHLKSTQEKEDLGDWMSYHHNEKNEWLRYGAAIYLRGCDGFEVKNVKVHGGQNALMITECDTGLIWNNDFSFNSSLGLGMYKSSDNKIMHNKMDWNVRGYSHGVYNRGQDSAGILIYEQSNKNVFAYNSVTHGGDGLFLWAGQTTMDNGKGGCNDNLLYGNDWSHAPTNGIEATFSRNDFINNLILECWHGIWGGYSYDSKVIGNVFGLNAQAIAWEHGQDNLVQYNTFHRDNEGIHVWFNDRPQDPNWGYPKYRDTKSRDWTIKQNVFSNISTNALRINNTVGVKILDNLFKNNGKVLLLEGTSTGVEMQGNTVIGVQETLPGTNNTEFSATAKPMPPTMQPSGNVILGLDPSREDYLKRFDVFWLPFPGDGYRMTGEADEIALIEQGIKETRKYAPKPLAGGMMPFIKKGELRGRRYILVDEWGPYDFKSPILWQRHTAKATGAIVFEVLGPNGNARILQQTGLTVQAFSSDGGTTWKDVAGSNVEVPVPSMIRVLPSQTNANNRLLELEYRGATITTPFGEEIAAGKPYKFRYSKFYVPFSWDVRWYAWDKTKVADPKADMPSLGTLLSRTELQNPIKREKTDKIDYAWGGALGPGLPSDHFATMADGSFEVPAGDYVLTVTTDDGIKVWVDDKLVISSWKYQGPTNYAADLKLTGSHRIRLEHYEIDGYAALKVDLQPKR